VARLAVRLLGPFEVTLDGKPVAGFRSDKVRALLAYLCVEPAGHHRREKLAGLLWPDLPEGSARTNLRHALANLRQVIGDQEAEAPLLSVTPQTIQIDAASEVWTDVTAVARLLKSAHLQQLEQAVALYRGDLLEGFSLPDSSLFEEWALLHRERLHRLLVDTLHNLAEAYEQRGDYERALRHAWRQVELEPWREAAHRQVMRLLALSNQRLAALAQFETCRRLLADEMGVEPEPETAALYEQIRGGAFRGGSVGEVTPPPRPGPPVRVYNVPVPLTPLVGREAELAEIERHLGEPSCRLLTLVGPGGVGKTHLALEAMRAQAGWFADGVFFVASAPLELPGDLVTAIAQAIGLTFYEGQEPRQQLLEYLRGKEMLLLLDCLERPEADHREVAELVARMLGTAAGLKILATSRCRLNVAAEQVLSLTGLGDGDAVKLFLLGARRAHPGYQPTAKELADVSRIGRTVGGLPLALLMAAAWVGMLTPVEIAAQLCGEVDEGLDLLVADWHDLPERQRSLQMVFEQSWALLPAREREVLQGLSVFRGGFSRQAAQAVAGASLGELRALADRSLLRYTSAQRYEVHEIVRQYTAKKLDAAGSACEAAHARHSAYYVALMARAWEDLRGLRQQAVLSEMEIDGDNLRAAWDWAVARQPVDLLAQAMAGLLSFFWSHGRYQEGEAVLQAAVERLVGESSHRPEVLRLLAEAMVWQANFCRLLGRGEQCEQLLSDGTALLDWLELAGQDVRREKAFLFRIGGHAAFKGDYGQARRLYGQSLELSRVLDDRWGMAHALSGLGRVALFAGEIGEAGRRLEECLAIRQALGDPRGTVSCMADLAEVEMLRGHFAEAERLARESCARSRRVGGRAESAYGLLVWGEMLEAAGRFAEARQRLEEGLAGYEELHQDHYVSYARAVLATVEMHQGRYEQAREHARVGLALARQVRLPYRIGSSLLALGGVALAQGAYAAADSLLQECVASYQRIGQRADQGWAMALLGYAAHGLRDYDRTRRCLRDALALAAATGSVLPKLWALPQIALLLAMDGKVQRAAELHALAWRYPLVARSRWFEAVAGDQIASLAANLSPEMAAAAQAWGRSCDLDAAATELWAELS
jgi:DNA-binding SARP family transcriptional activator/predicted ATPase